MGGPMSNPGSSDSRSWNIRRIGHISIRASDPDKSARFYHQLLGFEITDSDSDGRIYLSCGRDHHNVVLVPTNGQGVADIGFVVGSEHQLDAAANSLEQAGILVDRSESAKAGQGTTLRFCDPAGVNLELYSDLATIPEPLPGHPARPVKFGHVTMQVTDLPACHRFYTQLLGFRTSDWIEDFFVWLRCNSDHHALAFVQSPQTRVHHYGFDLVDFTELKRACDFLAANDYRITYGPGRHGPGNNLFLYFPDQDGHYIEYQAELQQIDDDEHYQPKVWKASPEAMNQWGPAPPEGFQ
jgi:catechol 2,3-dioxygenase